MMRGRWRYRVWQGGIRLRAGLWPGSIDRRPARAVLHDRAWELFLRASAGDQAHSLCVLHTLERSGPVAVSLASAALLHDIGKVGAGLSLAYRTAIVLLRASGRLDRWAADQPGSWRYPIYLQLQHARRGAFLCEEAGCDARTVALVRWHETPLAEIPDQTIRADLERLQAADDRC